MKYVSLESRVHRKVQARFGKGREEKVWEQNLACRLLHHQDADLIRQHITKPLEQGLLTKREAHRLYQGRYVAAPFIQEGSNMITVTFYPLDTERYGRVFVREFPDLATWERVKTSLTGTYHSIEVSYPPNGSNYHDHLCRCPGCNYDGPEPTEEEIARYEAEIGSEPSPLDEQMEEGYHRIARNIQRLSELL